jgi:hypothetical protein
LTFSGTSSSLSRPLKHLKASIDTLTASTDTLTAYKALSRPLQSTALNWLVIGNSQVLSHGYESVAEAKKVPVEVVREPVAKTVFLNSGTNQNVLVLFQNF